MIPLSIQNLSSIKRTAGLSIPGADLFDLSEKVLQFGTGVLLRGLTDYYIDKANKQDVFNGRIVVVKSTTQGATDEFKDQDGLFTHCIRGSKNNRKIEENIINGSISRLLSANDEWQKVLECAANPCMEIVISNTTEVGIALVEQDKIDAEPPVSFPGKLLAFLYRRYQVFEGDTNRGMVIVPTELLVDNADKLKAILIKLAELNGLSQPFIKWLDNYNYFCNSLVDRIVPGKLSEAEQNAIREKHGYQDDLMIMSESYSLWAIETSSQVVKDKLSFSTVDDGVVIAADINKFRELKLRLLNATHTLTSGLAVLAGVETVKQGMNDARIECFVRGVMLNEIAPIIIGSDISYGDAEQFAGDVMDRFANPFIEHKWLSITVQYSSKMKSRVLPLLLHRYKSNESVPQLIALGFAAYIAFMRVTRQGDTYIATVNGNTYQVQDDHAPWFASAVKEYEGDELVKAVLGNQQFWGQNLCGLTGFCDTVINKYNHINQNAIGEAISAIETETAA